MKIHRSSWVTHARTFALVASFVPLSLEGCSKKPKAAEAMTQPASVQSVSGPGAELERCDLARNACTPARAGDRIPAGSVLRTGSRTRATIEFGRSARLTLDQGTELSLPRNAGLHARLERGSVVLALTEKVAAHARFDVNAGFVELADGEASLRVNQEVAILDVVRGSATVSVGGATPLSVRAGEEARIERGSAPYVTSGARLAQAVAFANETPARTDEDDTSVSKGLGELTARKPGSTDEVRGAVKLASHSVRVRIAGAMVRTEIDEEFDNSSDDVLEGIYRFPVPADAKIERLALEVDGKLEEGAFVDRDHAAAIWRGAIVHAAPRMRQQIQDEIVWVPGPWRDPALLEWQRGGRFELRIFPIPKRGRRRIVLAYTQAVKPVGGVRRFTYPLPIDPGGTTHVRHFDVNVQVRGQDPAFGVRVLGYPLTASDPNGVRTLDFSADNFSPNGDLSIEWALPDRQSELSAFGYRSGDERYALLTLRPKLPRDSASQAHATAIVVDSSRSMYGESFERARKLAVRLARELNPDGSVTLLVCDSTCQQIPEGVMAAGPSAASAIERFLAGSTAEGASDLTSAVAAANRALAANSGPRDIVYIGDGTPTVGPIRPATVASAVRDALAGSPTRVTGVAVGSASDLDSLAAIARAGGGVVLPYVPGQTLNDAALGVLSATYGSALRNIEVVLPDGLEASAPKQLDTLLSGEEASISARMTGDHVDGTLILRGKVGEAAFEQRYPVHVSASDNPGNAFVPRTYAAARIADLEQAGSTEAKSEAISLSTRFSVASRWTSLLVLENEAMLRAFGLRTETPDTRYTGEELAEQNDAQGELEVSDPPVDATSALKPGASSAATSTRDELGSSGSAIAAPSPMRAGEPRESAAKASSPALDRADDFAQPPPALTASPSRLPAPEMRRKPTPPAARHLVPMLRVWDRRGTVITNRFVPANASITAVADAERALTADPDRRANVKKAYFLYAVSGDLGRAANLVERWSGKEPLDPEALTARADLAARRGDRELAVRILGSVVDVRPDDVASQKRLARLYRWSGRPDLGCRYSMAIAELHANNAPLLAEALRCARAGTAARWASEALSLVDEKTARAAQSLANAKGPDDGRLLGDLRVEATWTEDADLDLALLHPDGHRVSWLGAPTREVITARDVLARDREGLALNGAKPGEYTVEIVRSAGQPGPIHGVVTVVAASETRRLPFTLTGQRMTLAIASIKMVPRLIALEPPSIASDF